MNPNLILLGMWSIAGFTIQFDHGFHGYNPRLHVASSIFNITESPALKLLKKLLKLIVVSVDKSDFSSNSPIIEKQPMTKAI